MIRILPKYVVREHIGPFFFALAIINAFFVLNLLFRQFEKFLSKGISFVIVSEFLFLNLAWMIALSVPCAVLTATIWAFGRLSAENEMTAARASGIGLHQILPPMLLLSTGLTIGLIWFNNHVLPDFNHRTRLLAVDIARKKPTLDLDEGVLYTEIPDFGILAQTVREEGKTSYLGDVVIDDQSNANSIKTIAAEQGVLSMDDQTGVLDLALHRGELHEIDLSNSQSFKRVYFDKHVIRIPMGETILRRTQSGYRGDREKSASDLLENVHQNQERVRERQMKVQELIQKQVTKYSQAVPADKRSVAYVFKEHQRVKRQIQTELNMIKSYEKYVNVYLVEVHKKYSIPVACIAFVLVGAPLGILVRRQGWAVAALLSLGFFILYWAFLIGGEILADRQKITPFTAMWSPNILIIGIGILLNIRVMHGASGLRSLLQLRRNRTAKNGAG